MANPTPPQGPTAGPLPYQVSYIIAVVVFVVGAFIGILDGLYIAGHAPDWMSAQVFANFSWIAPLLVVISGILPAVTYRPDVRALDFARAAATGQLPRDADKP